MRPIPKGIKRHLSTLVGQAYENELARELETLAAQVDEWRAGRLGAGELAHWIHQYDTGPLREMYKRYNSGYHELQIAGALQEGLLQESDIPEEVWPYLQGALAFIKTHTDEDHVD
jgi:hypothetical protein